MVYVTIGSSARDEDSCGAHCRHWCCRHLRRVILLLESDHLELPTVGGNRKRERLQKHTRQHRGKRKAMGILMFHAMTGCDVASAFHGVTFAHVPLSNDI